MATFQELEEPPERLDEAPVTWQRQRVLGPETGYGLRNQRKPVHPTGEGFRVS
jgi:hypothetical protein